MNENSASASEILAGAVQDNDRGTIVGLVALWKGFGTTRNEFEGWVSGTFNSCYRYLRQLVDQFKTIQQGDDETYF
jgi:hypothetical protein